MNRPTVWDKVRTINSAARTLLLVLFLGALVGTGLFAWYRYIRPGIEAQRLREEIAALQVRFEEQRRELEHTRTALKLVKVDHRKATIEILSRGTDPDTGEPWFEVEFVELTPEGIPLAQPRRFRLKGTMMYIDSWVVKFEDKYVEQADELRGGSLCVFKGLWGDLDSPEDHYLLDDAKSGVNTAYGTLSEAGPLEQKIWDDFWDIANHPELQNELGVRANHGQINYLKVEPGMLYEINLRASDGLTIKVARDKNT
jgi:hypothetical protein